MKKKIPKIKEKKTAKKDQIYVFKLFDAKL